jgi:GTP-dependent phosphoenolpyruvate carboxykinase
LDYVITKSEILQRMGTMKKSNVEQVAGFLKCLIAQREPVPQVQNKRIPLLATKRHET